MLSVLASRSQTGVMPPTVSAVPVHDAAVSVSSDELPVHDAGISSAVPVHVLPPPPLCWPVQAPSPAAHCEALGGRRAQPGVAIELVP